MAISEATVDEVADVLRAAREAGNCLSLLTGAGVSLSAGIGLAGDFVSRIEERHHNLYCKAQRGCGDARKPNYAECMAALTPAMQVHLIREDVDKSRINWAHVGIARLEAGGHLDTILTTNFDPLASRACALFNRFPAIYDLAGLRDEQANQIGFDKSYVRGSAIFHLHGQHTGFLLLNTEEKLRTQAERIAPVLNSVMRGRPVIIAGYSGENDPLVEKIAALAPFNHGLYWVCYDAKDPAPSVCDALLSRPNCHVVRNKPADTFFTELANALSLDAPVFLADPFGHMLEVIGTVRPYSDLGEGKGSDLVESARNRLQAARERQEQEAPDSAAIAQLMAKGSFQEILDLYQPKVDLLPDSERQEVAWAAVRLGNALTDKAKVSSSDEAAQLYRQGYDQYVAALSIMPNMDEALYNWGTALSDQAESSSGNEAVRLYREAVDKYAAALAIRPGDYETLYNLGNALSKLAEGSSGDEAVQLYGEAGAKYAAALAIKPDQHEALNNLGLTLYFQAQAGPGDQADQLLAAAEEKFEAAEVVRLGSAAYNRACVAGLRGNDGEAADWLRKSAEAGTLPAPNHVLADSDFDRVRDSETFQAALRELGLT